MPQSFNSIALIGNAKDSRVAECMLSLVSHLYARGQRANLANAKPSRLIWMLILE